MTRVSFAAPGVRVPTAADVGVHHIFGEAMVRSDPAHGLDDATFGTFTWVQGSARGGSKPDCWFATDETIKALNGTKPEARNRKVKQMVGLRDGQTGAVRVVKGVVQPAVRHAPSRTYAVADLSPLVERAEHLVIQIASIPSDQFSDGQRDEMLKTYASIVTELERVQEQIEGIEDHLSIVRGQLMDFALTDPT
jgi:hypothetical protein